MKIRRIIAAVMALVLVGGAYPSNAVNTRNIGKVYAVEAAEEKEPQFLVEKDEYKRLEPFSITVKNVDPASVSFTEENIEDVSKSSDENGNLVYTFKARQSGEAHLIIKYSFDSEIRQKQFNFNILEETYEDENSPKFFVEKDEYKRLEPFSITVKNVDPASVSFTEENIEDVSKSSDENGNLVYTFKARQSGEAHLIIKYSFDSEIRQKQFDFNILEETYEDENSPKFFVDKDEYKRLEPFSITVKNVDPASVSFTEEDIEDVSKSSDEDGNLVFTFKARQSGEAHLIINYGFDGETREQRYNFNILEETYEDENSPKFLIEKDEYKRLEPFAIKVKNVDPATISFVEENIEEVSKSSDEDGNLVFTFKARQSGEAHLIINYGFDGETREQRYNFNILEETYEDENSPKFLIEKDEFKRLEPFSIKVKNVDPATISFVEGNIEEVSKSSDEDGNLIFTFKARKSGEAHLIINYGFDGETREQRYNFNILEETYEDENSPKFLIEKDEFKRLEPFSIKVKNVDPATISFVEENIEEVSKSSDEDGNLVFTFKARQSGEAHLIINYGFDGETREYRYNFNILEEEYTEENTQDTNVKGDANCDGSVDMSDVVLIMQALANPNKYGVNGTEKFHITQQGMKNSDVDTTVKGVTVSDALKIQRYLLGAVEL